MSNMLILKRIKRLCLALQCLVIVGYLLIIVSFALFFFVGGDVLLFDVKFDVASLGYKQRAGFVLFFGLPMVALLYIFTILYQLAMSYRREQIFAMSSIRCFRSFARGLLVWGLLDFVSVPLTVVYLKAIGVWTGEYFVALSLEDLVGGPMFFALGIFIIGEVMSHGKSLAEDAELTI